MPKPTGESPSPAELIKERKHVHGDWLRQSRLAFDLKMRIGAEITGNMKPHQQEALDMILVKVSRICIGDPSHADHWDDIAGYALLGKQGHDNG